ncbi:MAG: hypothetical protein ACR2KZ_06935, partial [Segetibacter sp.]
MKKYIQLLSLVSVLVFGACKKETIPETASGTGQTAATSQSDLLKDSVYLYSKEIFLWPEVLPSYDVFNPRQYKGASDQESATTEMNAIRALQPLDRFSFVTTKEESAGLQTGASVDYGFFVKAAAADKAEPIDSVRWFVEYAFDKSSAGLAGVNRGWFINKINNTPIIYNQSSIDLLNQTLFGTGNSATFEFVKPDGTTATVNLTKTSFTSNAVLHRSVIDAGGKKVGYFVLKQFFAAPTV